MIECVPNVSEGRDAVVIRRLVEAVQSTGVPLIDVHSDVDHHRSVFTLIGETEVVEAAVLALARVAVQCVDLTRHRGVHPRVGALDVVPFVPFRGSAMADAVVAAHRVGRAVAAECGVPVFFYGEAAARRDRRELPTLRWGGFEGLGERLCHPDWRPDAGPAAPHPTAGASIIGARWPLIAFNAMLSGPDRAAATAIARAVRESSGGLPAVQAMGVFLASRGCAQVSMNLLDPQRTGPAAAARRVEAEARCRGAAVTEYELVGCAPADAFDPWPEDVAPVAGLRPSQLLDPALFAARPR